MNKRGLRINSNPVDDHCDIKIYSHKDCQLARGIKIFECFKCGNTGNNYYNGVEYCEECREELNICDICGYTLDDKSKLESKFDETMEIGGLIHE